MIKLLLTENQPLTRLGVRVVIEGEDGIELTGESDNAEELGPVAFFKQGRDSRTHKLVFGAGFVHCHATLYLTARFDDAQTLPSRKQVIDYALKLKQALDPLVCD